jgi:hypothetical protein
MTPSMNTQLRHRLRISSLIVAGILAMTICSFAAEPSPQVVLDTAKATPRAVESLTQNSILRDYKSAWISLSHALESNSSGVLNGPFEGTASDWVHEEVASQRRNGMESRYLNQKHSLEAVFYAPEGDVMELHDTAEYDLEVLDGDKTIHKEHAIVHYVVLMTPAADHWVVRQLQAVPQF